MTTTVRLDDNIEDVIADVQEIIGDLRSEMFGTVKVIMEMMRRSAERYIRDDAELSGQMRNALNVRTRSYDRDSDDYHIDLAVNNSMAGYAAVTEYGSGSKTNETTAKAGSESVEKLGTPPGNFPYTTPNIGEASMTNPKFAAFVGHIKDWMIEKGVEPEKETLQASAQAITHEIVTEGTYAHPFLRPAWFDHERELERATRAVVKEVFR